MNKYSNLQQSLTTHCHRFQEESQLYKLFEIIFDYVEEIEKSPKLKKWLDEELRKKYQANDKILESREKGTSTKEEREQLFVFSVYTNIWHVYGYFKSIHDALVYQKQGKTLKEWIAKNKKAKHGDLTLDGFLVLDNYPDLLDKMNKNWKLGLVQDLRKINNQIFAFLDEQAKKEEAQKPKQSEENKEDNTESNTPKEEKVKPSDTQNQSSNIDYSFDKANLIGWFNFAGQELNFSGRVAVIFYFFYASNKIDDTEYKTYHDFKNHIKEQNIKVGINSVE